MYNKDILGLDFVIFRIKHVFCLAYIIEKIFWIYFRSSFLFVFSHIFFCIAVRLGFVARALSKVIIQGFKLQEFFCIAVRPSSNMTLLSCYSPFSGTKMLLKILFKKLFQKSIFPLRKNNSTGVLNYWARPLGLLPGLSDSSVVSTSNSIAYLTFRILVAINFTPTFHASSIVLCSTN